MCLCWVCVIIDPHPLQYVVGDATGQGSLSLEMRHTPQGRVPLSQVACHSLTVISIDLVPRGEDYFAHQ